MSSVDKRPLVVIPAYSTSNEDLQTLGDALTSVRKSVSDGVEILVVDDGSPDRKIAEATKTLCDLHNADCELKRENEGFSRTVNVGLRRALDEGRAAVLMNADVEIETPGWAKMMEKTKDSHGSRAAVVGARLLFPNGLIQHGGIYFSLLTRTFDHKYKYGPANLPAALASTVCPVTGAFQWITNECLTEVGLYDEEFRMGWEDVDYCIRVMRSGRDCIYNPRIWGWHHEMMFRGRKNEKLQKWQAESWLTFGNKWANENFAGLVPSW